VVSHDGSHISSARRWLARCAARWVACLIDCWLINRIAPRIACLSAGQRLACPAARRISHFFRLSTACPKRCSLHRSLLLRVNCVRAGLLVKSLISSPRRQVARRAASCIARRISRRSAPFFSSLTACPPRCWMNRSSDRTSARISNQLFLPLVDGLRDRRPAGSLISSARRLLARQAAHQIDLSFHASTASPVYC
jgi:hypothetical protein